MYEGSKSGLPESQRTTLGTLQKIDTFIHTFTNTPVFELSPPTLANIFVSEIDLFMEDTPTKGQTLKYKQCRELTKIFL